MSYSYILTAIYNYSKYIFSVAIDMNLAHPCWMHIVLKIRLRREKVSKGKTELCLPVFRLFPDHIRSGLTETIYEQALCHRQPDPSLFHHSNRGSQYTCSTYRETLNNRVITVGMNRIGNCLIPQWKLLGNAQTRMC